MRAVRADPGDRENNLNLLRLVAALAVMVSHAWPIVHGPGTAEPLEAATGYTLGTMAVMVFFGLSGFLIAASWDRAPDAKRFVARRARRLLPALWVMLGLSALAMGPAVTSLGTAGYLADPGTWRFLVRNALLLPVEPALPGVFTGNPYPAAAGSIWTLHYEATCYLALLAAGMAGLIRRRHSLWLLVGLIAAAVAGGDAAHPRIASLLMLGLPFGFGVAAYVWRDVLAVGLPGTAMLMLSACAAQGTALYPVLFTAALVHATLWAGFVPCRWARAWNRVGDISYGVYLYAFPVQGLVQYLWAPETVTAHLMLAAMPVIVLATLSWQLVEKPWLRGPRTGDERVVLRSALRSG